MTTRTLSRVRPLCVILLGLLALAGLTGCGASATGAHLTYTPIVQRPPMARLDAASTRATTPRFDHVIIVMLENEDEADAFSPGAPTHYLSRTLPAQGALIANYYGIGHHSLDNYLAIISGQAPNADTQSDCPTLVPDAGHLVSGGQWKGTGCVYPKAVPTLAGQLEHAGLSWGEYAQDMAAASGPGVVNADRNACVHPAYGDSDTLAKATADSQYATRHNPWVYFRSISNADCVKHDVDLSRLPSALAHPGRFPSVAMITPDLCNDGHDATCADGHSAGGVTQVDAFLKTWIPRITGSATYRQGRTMIVVTFDEAESDESSSCCHEESGPNVTEPGVTGPGGGKIGAVVISPHTRRGTFPSQSYNHYGLLATIAKNFGLPRLGYARGARVFGSDVFNR